MIQLVAAALIALAPQAELEKEFKALTKENQQAVLSVRKRLIEDGYAKLTDAEHVVLMDRRFSKFFIASNDAYAAILKVSGLQGGDAFCRHMKLSDKRAERTLVAFFWELSILDKNRAVAIAQIIANRGEKALDGPSLHFVREHMEMFYPAND